jgi:hypothetical protein
MNDQIAIALSLAVPIAIKDLKILKYRDVKSIRLTCKTLKETIDTTIPLKLKLTLNDRPCQKPDFKRIAASPLLESIHHLKASYYLEDEVTGQRLDRHIKRHFFPIVERMAPHLATLSFGTTSSAESFGRQFMQANLTFPVLKALSMTSLERNSLRMCQHSLFSMHRLEKLRLGGFYPGLTAQDVYVLVEAPFVGNLTYLGLKMVCEENRCEIPYNKDLGISTALAALLCKTRKLKELWLVNLPNMLCFNNISTALDNLTCLDVSRSHFDLMDFSALRSLQELSFQSCKCRVASLEALARAPDGSSQLPLLTKLSFFADERAPDDDGIVDGEIYEGFYNWLERLNLPCLESISFTYARYRSPFDIYRFGYAAATLPKLKNVELIDEQQNQPTALVSKTDVDILEKFFTCAFAENLEVLDIRWLEIPPIAFEIFLKNGHHMKKLRSLEMDFKSSIQFEGFLRRGRWGCWPCLTYLNVGWGFESEWMANIPSERYQELQLNALWPKAEIVICCWNTEMSDAADDTVESPPVSDCSDF